MIRTQIQLTDAEAAAVKARAAAEGRSMADVIRSCVDAALPAQAAADPAERMRRALAAVGSLRGGPTDLAAKHDAALADSHR